MPDGAKLTVTVDGKPRTLAQFDGYGTYHRLSNLDVASNLPGAVHEISITVLAESPDKAALLFEKNRPELKKTPCSPRPAGMRLDLYLRRARGAGCDQPGGGPVEGVGEACGFGRTGEGG